MCWIIKPLEVKSFFDFLLLFDQAKSKRKINNQFDISKTIKFVYNSSSKFGSSTSKIYVAFLLHISDAKRINMYIVEIQLDN
jgi:hypothetical protein